MFVVKQDRLPSIDGSEPVAVDASDLGLRPGQWPELIRVESTFAPPAGWFWFLRRNPSPEMNEEGELLGWKYTSSDYLHDCPVIVLIVND